MAVCARADLTFLWAFTVLSHVAMLLTTEALHGNSKVLLYGVARKAEKHFCWHWFVRSKCEDHTLVRLDCYSFIVISNVRCLSTDCCNSRVFQVLQQLLIFVFSGHSCYFADASGVRCGNTTCTWNSSECCDGEEFVG